MRNLNLDQLRTLIEVTESGSFSAAARRLNLTQPAVSLQIRELEQRFGVKLVERQGRTARATTAGSELVEHARRILGACESAATAMHRSRDGGIGRVHIGTTNTALTYALPPILHKLRRDHPGIELLVTNMASRDTVEQIIHNKLDLGLVTLPVDETHLRVTPLRPEMLVAILPAETPDIPDMVTPAYAAAQSLVLEHSRAAVHALVMQWLAAELPLQRTPVQLGTIEAMKNLVEMGFGMSMVPDVAVAQHPPGVVVRPLDPPVPCTLALVEHRSKANNPALETVRTMLLELTVPALPAARHRGESTTVPGPQPPGSGRPRLVPPLAAAQPSGRPPSAMPCHRDRARPAHARPVQ